VTETRTRLIAALADRYRIERELGQGGMATVYLAQDLKHDRKVAVKVLKPELAAVLGAERFVVEIRTTAALQHPHILPLFDSGTADGFLYYVMPFIDGETLRDRLNRDTQLGVDEAVRIAREVADALDYAHQHGVIHRDIKPENILLANGRPMVADFGIALAVSAAAGGRMTETGLSLGTPHYMSPEQATAEKEITGRSDIYSLGSVLYEMLTGEPPHMGNSAQQIIMKIITEDAAPVTKLRKSVPPNVAAAVARSLEKLPADRFETTGRFSEALGDPGFSTRATARDAAGPRATVRDRLRDPVQVTLVAVALLAVVGLVWSATREKPVAERTPVEFVLAPSTARPVTTLTWPAIVSPDGRQIVYAGEAGANTYQFYARRVDELNARALPGTINALLPIFSPDGRWIAFEVGGQLLKMQLDGGVPQPIVGANSANGAAWAAGGEIILGSEGAIHGLARVAEGGGKLTALTTPDAAEQYHVWPVVLSDGRSILMSVWDGNGKSSLASHLAMTSLDDGVVHPLGVVGSRALGVVHDHLIYLQFDGTVMGIPFDARRKRVTGTAVALLDSIPLCRSCNGDAPVYLSQSGALAYIRGGLPTQLVWVDTLGNARRIAARGEPLVGPRLSPDGRRIAVTSEGRQRDVWIYEIANNSWNRLTSDGNNSHPEWTADGSRVVFISDRGGKVRAWQQAADFSGVAEPLSPESDGLKAAVPIGNGPTLVLNDFHSNISDIWTLTVGRDKAPVAFMAESWWNGFGRPSPDGSQIAYVSGESAGGNEVWVGPYPGPGGRVQISSSGGSEPVWSRDGRRLFYIAGRRMMVATLSPLPNVRVLARDSLFLGEGFGDYSGASYDVAADGRGFLMLRTDEEHVRLVIALDWASGVGARFGAR
jgi:Tol biopolymer transport system component/tRNA A-37 threonylcarbamoyl transferase component Bud32